MDCMTDTERQIYNVIIKDKNRKDFKKHIFEKQLIDEINKYPLDKPRYITKEYLYITDDEGKCTEEENINRQTVLSENEIIRHCAIDDSEVPLVKQIVLMKCKSELMTDILNQIIDRGVVIGGVPYVFYTSSTNQMKNSEITLLEESFWKTNKMSLMCGLTEETINAKGGINTGKYLAAKALNMSNSVIYDSGISIDDVIIVKDFKTMITSMVNYLNIDTLEISEREMSILIEHMDGAGIFIPGTFPCSCQIRGGWLKGAIFPFDFHAFLNLYRENVSEIHMQDAWGNQLNIDDFLKAKLILTDSQLKMRKYYTSMDEYRQKLKESKLSITVNNWSHEPNKNAEVRVAYQPFQTIPRQNMTEEAIEKLCEKTIAYINEAKTTPNVALKLMGVDIESYDNMEQDLEKEEESITGITPLNMDTLNASIMKCPRLLNDIHVRKVMQSALISERNKAMGSKLIMDGIWSYVCPDLFAFCQWLFLGDDNPDGLVKKGKVYNNFYKDKDIEEVCCIRYPHLSDCEHGIRNLEKSDECAKWFIGFDTIVSCHDLISKTLQCDWDGDHICLIHDKSFLNVLNRDVLPLYYEMSKAEPSTITNEEILNCLVRSFTNENIGYVSNAITKIFSSNVEPDIKLVRILCAYNNFVIDYFKTQKRMELKDYEKTYKSYKDYVSLCPYFFKYAKKKKSTKCEKFNPNSNCDKISRYIQQKTDKDITKTVYATKDKDEFNSEYLKNHSIEVIRKSKEYNELRELLMQLKSDNIKRYKTIAKQCDVDSNEKISDKELFYYRCNARISKIITDRKVAANYLVDIEYCQPENEDDKKDILWKCFGDILYGNIIENVNKNSDIPMKVKRKAYQSFEEKVNEIEKEIQKAEKEISNNINVPISQNVYDSIMNIKCRKDCQNDSYILFILYVLINRFQKKYSEECNYIRIYKRRKDRITIATIDGWLEAKSTTGGLKRLEKNGYINIEELKYYRKISLCTDFLDDKSKQVFSVESSNPLIDLFRYNGDRKVKKCAVCKRWFLASRNKKTCCEACGRKLEKINKTKM